MHKCEYTITCRVSQSITIFDVIQHIYFVIHIVQIACTDIYIYHIHIQDHIPWYQHIYLYVTTDNKWYHLIIGYMTNHKGVWIYGRLMTRRRLQWMYLASPLRLHVDQVGAPVAGPGQWAPGFRSPQTWLGWEVSPKQGGKIMGKLVYFFCKWRFIAGKGNELCEWRWMETEREREKCGIFQHAMFDDAGRVAGCSSG
jgi:hypothetical protein